MPTSALQHTEHQQGSRPTAIAAVRGQFTGDSSRHQVPSSSGQQPLSKGSYASQAAGKQPVVSSLAAARHRAKSCKAPTAASVPASAAMQQSNVTCKDNGANGRRVKQVMAQAKPGSSNPAQNSQGQWKTATKAAAISGAQAKLQNSRPHSCKQRGGKGINDEAMQQIGSEAVQHGSLNGSPQHAATRGLAGGIPTAMTNWIRWEAGTSPAKVSYACMCNQCHTWLVTST